SSPAVVLRAADGDSPQLDAPRHVMKPDGVVAVAARGKHLAARCEGQRGDPVLLALESMQFLARGRVMEADARVSIRQGNRPAIPGEAGQRGPRRCRERAKRLARGCLPATNYPVAAPGNHRLAV